MAAITLVFIQPISSTFWCCMSVQEPLFVARVVYDLLFFFIVIIIVLNLIFGVIIDTFADLRSEKQQKELILKDTCFICGEYNVVNRLRWSSGSILAFSTQVCGFKPGRSRRIFRAKNPQHAFLRREVKPSVPYRRFAGCKRSLHLRGSRNLVQNYRTNFSPTKFHLSLLGSLASLRTYRHLAAKVGTSKGGGKQWQTTPKNMPRMQCVRAIPVTWLGSGSCQPGL